MLIEHYRWKNFIPLRQIGQVAHCAMLPNGHPLVAAIYLLVLLVALPPSWLFTLPGFSVCLFVCLSYCFRYLYICCLFLLSSRIDTNSICIFALPNEIEYCATNETVVGI